MSNNNITKEDLVAFLAWLPKNKEEFAGKSPEDISNVLNEMVSTEEGASKFNALFKEFMSSKAQAYKDGGKIDALVNKRKEQPFKKFYTGGKTDSQDPPTINTPIGPISQTEDGEFVDMYGHKIDYQPGILTGLINRKRAEKEIERAVRDSTERTDVYHDLFSGPIYTRTTWNPVFIKDTVVSMDDKVYSNNWIRKVQKWFTGDSNFDRVNRIIDSLAGRTNTTEKPNSNNKK